MSPIESREAVLFANEAFYRAFADRDLSAMNRAWLKEGSVACIHPGWPALHERAQIMETWAQIFDNADNDPPAEIRGVRCMVMGDSAIVLCYEVFGDGALVATNVFQRVGAIWALAHHHASPTANVPKPNREEEAAERVLN